MKLSNIYSSFVAVLMILSACSAPAFVEPPGTQAPEITPPADLENAARQSITQFLSVKLGLTPAEISFVEFQPVEWADSCLGLPEPGEMCAEAIVPGYVGLVRAGERTVEFHSDSSGSTVRFIPGAVKAARHFLAAQLGRAEMDLQLVVYESVEWLDSCLGAGLPEEICTSVITPGYRVTFELDGNRHFLHTDESGGVIRTPPEAVGDDIDEYLSWTGDIDESCVELKAGPVGVRYGSCGSELVHVPYAGHVRTQLITSWHDRFASFDGDTHSGLVEFTGVGNVTATPMQQRAMAEWARLVYEEAQSGRSGAAWGLVLGWHRQGGIAGFCDDVGIYRSGEVTVNDCSSQPGEQPRFLTSTQLGSLYYWMDNFDDYEFQQKDPGTVDAMTVGLVFDGHGAKPPTEPEIQSMHALAAEFANMPNTPTNSNTRDAAQLALAAYIDALVKADYQAAAALYGGDYAVLQDWNPDIKPEDKAGLFERGCTQNGLVCSLSIRSVVQIMQLTQTRFRFSIEFDQPGGELYVREPCCGSSEANIPPESQFDFLVDLVDGNYKVMDLPVYVP